MDDTELNDSGALRCGLVDWARDCCAFPALPLPAQLFRKLDTQCLEGNSPMRWERATLAKLDRMMNGDGAATAPAMTDLVGQWKAERRPRKSKTRRSNSCYGNSERWSERCGVTHGSYSKAEERRVKL